MKQENVKPEKLGFLFGKGSLAEDSLSILIKYSIYFYAQKPFNSAEFLREVKIRYEADSYMSNRHKFELKWSIIKDTLNVN